MQEPCFPQIIYRPRVNWSLYSEATVIVYQISEIKATLKIDKTP